MLVQTIIKWPLLFVLTSHFFQNIVYIYCYHLHFSLASNVEIELINTFLIYVYLTIQQIQDRNYSSIAVSRLWTVSFLS